MEKRKKGGCQVRHPPFQQFTNHKTTTTMKRTIFEVVDLINRQDIDNDCWGVMPVYEVNEENSTDKLFGTFASMIVPKGTYLYLYALESECPPIDKLHCRPDSKMEIKNDFRCREMEWLYLWKIF